MSSSFLGALFTVYEKIYDYVKKVVNKISHFFLAKNKCHFHK